MKELFLFSIMPLDTVHINEICNDIKYQFEHGVANCFLFKMTLVPEGTPPVDKAKIMCEKYSLFKQRLSVAGIPNGILVQATIGHGWKLSEPFPFQKYTNLSDGLEQTVICPYDKGFHDYIFNTFKTIASYSPEHIMVDDDFRLIGRGSDGCGCPLHIKRFNELAGTSLSRKELHKIITTENIKKDEYSKIYLETQKESLIESAKSMRAGIDSVNPKIPVSFCCVGNNAEFAADIIDILAGNNHPKIIRINNGNYAAGGARFLSRSFQRAAAQIEKLKGKADIILAETDTCPQNRYSTGAMQLHAHFTGTILEGATGAKQWITRLSAYEPESGKAYRKILSKYKGFYKTLAETVPDLTWLGCRIPICKKPIYKFGATWDGAVDSDNGWSTYVLERLGLPLYFSSHQGGVLCLEGELFLTDEELVESLKGTVFIASDTALKIIERGFGKYIGVDAVPISGKTPSTEIYAPLGNRMSLQYNLKKLIPLSDDIKELSAVYHTTDDEHFEKLFPAVTMYKNELGGTVFVFCGTPKTDYNITDAFSFLNYTRKQQLINMLKSVDSLPIYYPNDEEIYLRAAENKNGGLVCAIFNIGLDPVEKLELVSKRNITTIKKLMPNGKKEEIDFEQSGERYTLNTNCPTLDPCILYLD